MQQLRLALPKDRTDRVEAVYAQARAHGWVEERPSPTHPIRWHLPGTAWYCRANWHATVFYCLNNTSAIRRRLLPTDRLTEIALVMERIALAEGVTHG